MEENNMNINNAEETIDVSSTEVVNTETNTTNSNNAEPVVQEPAPNKASGLQIAGLVCGILSICFSCCYGVPGILLGVAGLICSIMGNKKGKHGVGTAGIVCSIIGLILGVLMLVYFIIIGFAVLEYMGTMDLNSYYY